MTEQHLVDGLLLDDHVELTAHDISRACSCSMEWVVGLVEEGVLEPSGEGLESWRFPGSCLRKANTSFRLHHDLGVNIAGVALALELLDEIERLHLHLHHLEPALKIP